VSNTSSSGRTPGDAETELEQRRCLKQALLDHPGGERDVAEVEHLQLRLHPGVADHPRHGLDVAGDVDHGVRAEVHRRHVQGADLRP